MHFDVTAPTATTLQNYSTEAATGTAGRNLTTTNSPSFSSNPSTSATAQWQNAVTATNGVSLSGNVYLDFWAMPASGNSAESLKFQAMVGYGSANGSGKINKWTLEGTGNSTTPATGCGTWREFAVTIPISAFSPKNNEMVEILLFDTGTTNARVAYDVALPASSTMYQSYVLWPGSLQ
jgi:hypothetical protein